MSEEIGDSAEWYRVSVHIQMQKQNKTAAHWRTIR